MSDPFKREKDLRRGARRTRAYGGVHPRNHEPSQQRGGLAPPTRRRRGTLRVLEKQTRVNARTSTPDKLVLNNHAPRGRKIDAEQVGGGPADHGTGTDARRLRRSIFATRPPRKREKKKRRWSPRHEAVLTKRDGGRDGTTHLSPTTVRTTRNCAITQRTFGANI